MDKKVNKEMLEKKNNKMPDGCKEWGNNETRCEGRKSNKTETGERDGKEQKVETNKEKSEVAETNNNKKKSAKARKQEGLKRDRQRSQGAWLRYVPLWSGLFGVVLP